MAAFLNALREEGTKADCIRMLEEMWTDELALRAENAQLRARIVELEGEASTERKSKEKAEAILEGIERGDIIPAKVSGPSDAPVYQCPSNGWVCFHCGHQFMTYGAARKHFGEISTDLPACHPAAQRVSELEARVAELMDKDLIGRLLARRDEAIQESVHAKAKLATLEAAVIPDEVAMVVERLEMQALGYGVPNFAFTKETMKQAAHLLTRLSRPTVPTEQDVEAVALGLFRKDWSRDPWPETGERREAYMETARAALTAYLSRVRAAPEGM